MKPKISIMRSTEGFKDRKGRRFTTNKFVGSFALDENNNYSPTTKRYYPILNVKSEKQLLWFIYNTTFDIMDRDENKKRYHTTFTPRGKTNRIVIMAHRFNHIGLYVFWKGYIGPEGYRMDLKTTKLGEINYLKKMEEEAEDEEEEYMWNADYENEKKELQKLNKEKTYGFIPYLIPSGKRGILHSWDEPDMAFNKERIKEEEKKVIRKKIDINTITINELNNF